MAHSSRPARRLRCGDTPIAVTQQQPRQARAQSGYKRPPEATRFAKGKSGNPRGRPRKTKPASLPVGGRLLGSNQPTDALILAEAYRTVKVREGDRVVDMPVNQAILRSLQQNALKGNRLAQVNYTSLLRSIEAGQREQQFEYFKALVLYKEEAEAAIARSKRQGIAPPDIMPHPDDIYIDVRNGVAEVRGPLTAEDKVEYDNAITHLVDLIEEVALCAAGYKKARSPAIKDGHLQRWLLEQRLFDIINDNLPGR